MSRLSKSERMHLWLERLDRFAESQLTVAEFCQREGISPPSFYQWKRRLSPNVRVASARQRRTEPAAGSNSSGFTELVVNSPGSGAVVSLPGSVTISLGADAEMAAMIVDRVLHHTRQQRPC